MQSLQKERGRDRRKDPARGKYAAHQRAERGRESSEGHGRTDRGTGEGAGTRAGMAALRGHRQRAAGRLRKTGEPI